MPVVWRVIKAINSNVPNVQFPFKSQEKLREHARTFFAVTTELPGTVAAGDGICLNIEAPTLDEVQGDVRSQFSRKGFYTYSVVVFCDAALRIMAATAEQCGSTGTLCSCIVTGAHFAQVTAWFTAAAGFMIILSKANCQQNSTSFWMKLSSARLRS